MTPIDVAIFKTIANDDKKWSMFVNEMIGKGSKFYFNPSELTKSERMAVIEEIFLDLERRESN